ncbi:hypothetical protein PFNF135_04753 [Plasmodium falciparum NF135/5.C10]|uniref:Uncharacterized protein n=1 Tax=Plasmodium falciparum NF135/5.C10 TaxID=1036726 RepID=W4IDM6_PLAFA|nr:hypothetical protein PFNF135_04753 [Plasmodium falciparum NF135/5.C10]
MIHFLRKRIWFLHRKRNFQIKKKLTIIYKKRKIAEKEKSLNIFHLEDINYCSIFLFYFILFYFLFLILTKLRYDEKIKNCSLMEIFKNYIKFFFLNYIEKNQLNSTVL